MFWYHKKDTWRITSQYQIYPDIVRTWYFWFFSNHKYEERVLLQIGTQVIDQLVATMTKKELQQAWETWERVYLSTILSKRNIVKGLDIPDYNLKGVKGKIHTIREVMIPPFGITIVKGKLDNTFKMFEFQCWASYRIFRTHCYGQILWDIKTMERQDWISCLGIIV